MPVGEEIEFLRVLAARGRFTGGAALREARALCAERLRAIGFTIAEQPFEYSTVPARFGMPIVGLVSGVLLAIVAGIEARGAGAAAAIAAGAGVMAVAALARWFTSTDALALRIGRAGGTNLQATRGDAPRVWLVAHLDSKSQRYPMALRAVGATITAAAWTIALVSAAAMLGSRGWWHPAFVWMPGVAGAGLLMFASSGDESPGAADNASGVVTVLAAAARLGDVPVGVVITDAEERGLAGAHAWAVAHPPGTAINCDTIDDRGALMLLTSRAPSARLRAAMTVASRATGVACGRRRLPVGVLTDGVALARAGWDCATLSRADIGTLLRIHTRRDSVEEYLRGDAIAPAAAFLAATVRELL